MLEREEKVVKATFSRIFPDDKRVLTGFAVALIVSVGDLVIQKYWHVGHLLLWCAIDGHFFMSDVVADRGFEASLVL